MIKPPAVVIFGAGPAGCAMALAMHNLGVGSVTVVHKAQRKALAIGESVSPGFSALLAELKLQIPPNLYQQCLGNCFVWGSNEPQYNDHQMSVKGVGWHLDRAGFDQWLFDCVIEAGIDVINYEPVQSIRFDGAWQVQLQNKQLNADFLVDATGRQAAIATKLGGNHIKLNNMVALATELPCQDKSIIANYSLIEACEWGWWYAAGTPNNKAVLSLMTTNSVLKSNKLQGPEGFYRALSQTKIASKQFECAELGGKIHQFAAMSHYLDLAAAPGWLAIGDAAIALDPLTSSGISSAFSDAIVAAKAIEAYFVDEMVPLQRYVQRLNYALIRYKQERAHYYRQENRWCDRAFWVAENG